MNTGRISLYDRYKDRRNGGLFFLALVGILGFFPAIFLAGLFCQNMFPEYSDQIALAVVALLCVLVFMFCVKVGQAVVAARRRRRAKANLSQLSSDELAKARSKLLKQRNRISL